MAVQNFSRIPLDVWFALAGGVAIVQAGLVAPAQIFAALYLMICGYVILNVFTDD